MQESASIGTRNISKERLLVSSYVCIRRYNYLPKAWNSPSCMQSYGGAASREKQESCAEGVLRGHQLDYMKRLSCKRSRSLFQIGIMDIRKNLIGAVSIAPDVYPQVCYLWRSEKACLLYKSRFCTLMSQVAI